MLEPAANPKVHGVALESKAASRVLAPLAAERRNDALQAMADALENATEQLLVANSEDLRAATGDPSLAPAILSRLRLDADKLREMVEQVRSVAALPDPLGRTLDAMELDDLDPVARRSPHGDVNARSHLGKTGLHLRKVSVPLGVLAVIFEARPDAVTQIAALALKSGNAVILKPGREVEHTAGALVRVLRSALQAQLLPESAISLISGREEAGHLLREHDLVDMVIPRGSKALVEYVQGNTRIPVLGHSEGVCHIYVDHGADLDLAMRVIADAKLDYPAACNAVETILLHQDLAETFMPRLVAHLRALGVQVHGDPAVRASLAAAPLEDVATVGDWGTEFGAPEVAIGIVPSLDAAIHHIHAHGSSHTESILTEDAHTAERFLREVDAAGVFHNVSTRFADGFRYGFGAEVGISTSKFHARGPVGLDGLTTYKYVLRGHGHVAGDYRGPHARAFTHRRETQ